MPLPAQPAPQQPVAVHQEQAQEQQQNVDNGFAPTLNDQSSTNSTSNAENAVNQIGTLSNQQYNYNNDSYYRSAKGTHLPERMTLNTTLNYNKYNGYNDSYNASIGLSYNFGGATRRILKDELILQQAQQTAALCTGLLSQNIKVDYELLPQYSQCKGFYNGLPTPPPIKQPTVSDDMKDMIRLMKEQQLTIEALQLRLTQIQNTPKVVKPTW